MCVMVTDRPKVPFNRLQLHSCLISCLSLSLCLSSSASLNRPRPTIGGGDLHRVVYYFSLSVFLFTLLFPLGLGKDGLRVDIVVIVIIVVDVAVV